MPVAAEVEDPQRRHRACSVPAVGNPNQLLLQDLPQPTPRSAGRPAGRHGRLQGRARCTSLYPPGIPIGTVSSANPQNNLLNNGQVQVTPAADLRHLDVGPDPDRARTAARERAQLP